MPGGGLLHKTIARFRPLTAGVVLTLAAGVAAAQNALPGERLFKQQCAACHSFTAGDEHRQGPNLFGIFEHKAGQAADYVYSPDFKSRMLNRRWSEELLDKWIDDPQNLVPETMMLYKQADAQIRRDIVDYLKSLK